MWARSTAFLILCAIDFVPALWAGGGSFQRATVTEMQTTECVESKRSVLAALSGVSESRHEYCAEYILVSPTIIFRVQTSKSAPILLPAEEVNFRSRKGGLTVRRDDEREEFDVKVVCMQLRGSKHVTCAAAVEVPPTVSAGISR